MLTISATFFAKFTIYRAKEYILVFVSTFDCFSVLPVDEAVVCKNSQVQYVEKIPLKFHCQIHGGSWLTAGLKWLKPNSFSLPCILNPKEPVEFKLIQITNSENGIEISLDQLPIHFGSNTLTIIGLLFL